VPVQVHLGVGTLNVFKGMPSEGAPCPYLSSVRARDRAMEMASRCRPLEMKGVT